MTLPRFSALPAASRSDGSSASQPAGRRKPQIEAAAVDAAQFPHPGEAGGAAFSAGESGHRGEGVAHAARVLPAGAEVNILRSRQLHGNQVIGVGRHVEFHSAVAEPHWMQTALADMCGGAANRSSIPG